MTEEQLDHWFRYHLPTIETAPKYRKLREAELRASMDIDDAIADDCDVQVRHNRINDTCKAFAVVIDELAPNCADKTAAIRCVRLARNAANEAIYAEPDHQSDLRIICGQELAKARWQANSAIACNGI